jgi:hypothetical protein
VLDSLHREVADYGCPKPTGCGQGDSGVHTSNRVAADVEGSPPRDFFLVSESAEKGALHNCTEKNY